MQNTENKFKHDGLWYIRGLNRVINKLSEDTNNGVETKSL